MSTINVNNIDKESGSTLTIGGSGTTVNVSNMVPDVALSNRNLIINGAMNVAQRGTSQASITTDGYYTADRWHTVITTLGAWTQSQSTDVPSGQGFATSLKMDCTTADASPASGDRLYVRTTFEGQNLQSLKKGTSNAESVTLSFWVKSNKTGTYVVFFYDQDNARSISKSYTIDSAGTWEKKTLTFSGDTTGAFDNDNALSLQVNFFLGGGSDWTSGTLNTSWNSWTQANAAVGSVNLADSTSNYINFTGIQLEVGDVATPFEHESYGQTLAKCQRYYHTSGNVGVAGLTTGLFTFVASSVSDASNTNLFPVEMRAAPTISFSDNAGTLNSVHRASIGDTGTTVTVNGYSKKAWLSVYKASGWGTGDVLMANYSADAEL